MTDALPTPCREPTCPETITGPYCEKHGDEAASRKAERDSEQRPSARDRGYDRHWERVRDRYLKKNPLCARCSQMGETRAADLVHHIVPLPEGDRLNPDNLQSLCRSCHQSIHSDSPV